MALRGQNEQLKNVWHEHERKLFHVYAPGLCFIFSFKTRKAPENFPLKFSKLSDDEFLHSGIGEETENTFMCAIKSLNFFWRIFWSKNDFRNTLCLAINKYNVAPWSYNLIRTRTPPEKRSAVSSAKSMLCVFLD